LREAEGAKEIGPESIHQIGISVADDAATPGEVCFAKGLLDWHDEVRTFFEPISGVNKEIHAH
jgi:hypothetical protein